MKTQIKTLIELKRIKGIKYKDMGVSRQTFYNIIHGKNKPYDRTIIRICKALEIDKQTFEKMLKNTIKTFNF